MKFAHQIAEASGEVRWKSNEIFDMPTHSELAFGKNIRDKIRERANNRSEISGRGDLPMECGHKVHGYSKDRQKPENGLLMTIFEHFMHHFKFQGKAHEIGLSERSNNWAIKQIGNRISEWASRNNVNDSDVAGYMAQANESVNDYGFLDPYANGGDFDNTGV